MDLSLSGLSSGFDWKTLVGQLVDVTITETRSYTLRGEVLTQELVGV